MTISTEPVIIFIFWIAKSVDKFYGICIRPKGRYILSVDIHPAVGKSNEIVRIIRITITISAVIIAEIPLL